MDVPVAKNSCKGMFQHGAKFHASIMKGTIIHISAGLSVL